MLKEFRDRGTLLLCLAGFGVLVFCVFVSSSREPQM